jgi:hypothetical protein
LCVVVAGGGRRAVEWVSVERCGPGRGRLEIMRWVTALRRISVRIRTITFRIALIRRVMRSRVVLSVT